MDVLHQQQQQDHVQYEDEEEEEEELLDIVDQNQRSAVMMMKGKRTKRPRTQVSPVSSSCNYYSVSSPTTSTSSEDEDMANCLILLAQGKIHSQDKPVNNNNNNIIMGPGVVSTVAGSNIVDVYECKTCNRTFQSFQALGGHRASHKKPKITAPPLISLLQHVDDHHDHVHVHVHVREMEHEVVAAADNNNKLQERLPISNNMQSKVHECSICGAEFSSGQALGGHMRRHRAQPQTQPAPVVKGQMMMMMNNYSNELQEQHHQNHQNEKKNLLGLDLNLPAPIDQEDSNNKFQFISSNMVFSAPALVYCHY